MFMYKNLFAIFLVLNLLACNEPENIEATYPMEVLVFTKTAGYQHESIPTAVRTLINLGVDQQFTVDTSSNADIFHIDSLSEYHVVVFLNTSGDVLNEAQQNAFQQYIRAGGGFVGVHAAADTEYDWEWYGNLVGGYFLSHPEIQPATLKRLDDQFAATAFLPDTFSRVDEWYDFKWMSKNVKTLLSIQHSSYKGSVMDSTEHAIAWYQHFDGGRSFYTGLGHTEASYTSDSLFLKHLLKGILWAGSQKE